MPSEQSRELCRRYFEDVLTKGDLAQIDALMAPDVAFYIPTIPGGVHGRDGVRQFVRTLRAAFPDGAFVPEPGAVIAEGDKAAARWKFRGTHRGEFLGIPPTGKAVTDEGIDVFHIAGGQIARIYAVEDAFGLLKQLGALPAAAP
jgi:steroid delta-isomerase-like uncharacterized protein